QLRERQRGYDEFDKLHALVLVQAAGGDCVEDVRVVSVRRGPQLPGARACVAEWC
ncbi:MAG: hypothetical protein HW381_1259, partial [Candidatus Rokubacteria bacterium]|nr:hypothetical protein [Candidatus Rokubacteria bacterium]